MPYFIWRCNKLPTWLHGSYHTLTLRNIDSEAAPESVTDTQNNIVVTVNGEAVEMMGKESYIFVDIFDRITFDLTAGKGRAIATLINGEEAEFSQPLHDGDRIDLYWKEN